MIEDYKEEQRSAVLQFLREKFNSDLSEYDSSESMLNSIIINIGSLKIWQDKLKEKIPGGPYHYINEIVSNLNNVLIMSSLGLKTSSFLMIRRSQENILSFLYYKDHPIEFYRKEADLPKKNQQLKINELKEYIEEYPFSILYSDINLEETRKAIKQITDQWQTQYKDLSNYVHGTNSQFMELTEFIEEIKPSNDFFTIVERNVIIFSSLVNSLFIYFFFDEYKSFKESEKQFIRLSIDNEFGFKEKIRYLFKEL